MAKGKHPNSLKNLIHILPGSVGLNPRGRPKAGTTIIEYMHSMADYTVKQLAKVLRDPASTVAKLAAAHQLSKAAAGKGDEFDRVMDRTLGKPTPITPVSDLGDSGLVEVRIVKI